MSAHNDDCQVHVVSRVHDRLVRAENSLLQMAHETTGKERTRLEAKASGVKLALSYLREEMRT